MLDSIKVIKVRWWIKGQPYFQEYYSSNRAAIAVAAKKLKGGNVVEVSQVSLKPSVVHEFGG